jgi:hypothetical protein
VKLAVAASLLREALETRIPGSSATRHYLSGRSVRKGKARDRVSRLWRDAMASVTGRPLARRDRPRRRPRPPFYWIFPGCATPVLAEPSRAA